MCHNAENHGVGLCLVPVTFDVLLGDRPEADNAAVEGLVELEVLSTT